MHGEGAGLRDAVPGHELVHVDLVQALEDGFGVIDDGHAERFRAAHELVDDAIDLGARPVEQGIEFGQALQCVGS